MTLTKFLQEIADAIRYADKSIDKVRAKDFADRIKKLGGNGFEIEIAHCDYEILTENNFIYKTILTNDYDEIILENKLEESEE